MDVATPLVCFIAGAAIGGLAVALAAARSTGRLRETLARTQSELDGRAEAGSRQRESFVALSGEVLDRTQKSFIELTRPMESTLKQLDARLQAMEKEREGAYRELRTQVASMGQANERLRTETATLSQALRAPHTRGRWGEIHLKRVIELAGMQPHCDFVEQTMVAGEGAVVRPDLIVNLPGGKRLVVDAKVPLTAYLEAQETTDETQRDAKLAEHARQMKDRVTRLSQRGYTDQFDQAPEFVVLYVPGEAFFSAAVARDPQLLEYGFSRGVVLASPSNLVALLKAIHYAWQQEKVAENAEKIRDLGVELYDRIQTLTTYFSDMGASLDGAMKSYNQAMTSLRTRVIVSARKMKELGAGSSKEIPEIEPIDREPASRS